MLKEPKPEPADALIAWCDEQHLPAPVREFVFAHPVRPWRFDLSWPALMVALEFEGGTFLAGGGGHTRGPAHRDDCDKFNEAGLRGWLVLRVPTSEAVRPKTKGLIQRAITVRAIREHMR